MILIIAFCTAALTLMLTITYVLEEAAKRFIGARSTRIETLYHGVLPPAKRYSRDQVTDKRKALGIDTGCFLAGLVGRIEEGKGQHLLIKAVALARQCSDRIHALTVGAEMKPGYRDTLWRCSDRQ